MNGIVTNVPNSAWKHVEILSEKKSVYMHRLHASHTFRPFVITTALHRGDQPRQLPRLSQELALALAKIASGSRFRVKALLFSVKVQKARMLYRWLPAVKHE